MLASQARGDAAAAGGERATESRRHCPIITTVGRVRSLDSAFRGRLGAYLRSGCAAAGFADAAAVRVRRNDVAIELDLLSTAGQTQSQTITNKKKKKFELLGCRTQYIEE